MTNFRKKKVNVFGVIENSKSDKEYVKYKKANFSFSVNISSENSVSCLQETLCDKKWN